MFYVWLHAEMYYLQLSSDFLFYSIIRLFIFRVQDVQRQRKITHARNSVSSNGEVFGVGVQAAIGEHNQQHSE